MRFSSVRLPNEPTAQDVVPMSGGLNLVTPPIFVPPGQCSRAQNYEVDVSQGYVSTKGYERVDGRPAPSDASYSILKVNETEEIFAGDVVTGVTSGATATVVLSFGSALAQDYLVITKVAGDFQAEDLQVSGVTKTASTDSQILNGAAAVATGENASILDAQYRNLAADNYRADIGAVPGSGPVLGVRELNDVLYAWRDNGDGTAAEIYKTTSTGWELIPLGFELAFTSGGIDEILEGDTITGDSSGATATVTRVLLENGSWAAGTAEGRFIFASQTGTFTSEDLNSGNVTIAGDSTAITLLPGGSYEFINESFSGLAGGERIYGVDSVNRGFEFDGTVFAPIDSGMEVDTPEHIGSLANQLFFSFAASVQHSGIGTPYNWTVVLGAGEIAIGDPVTAFAEQPGVQGNASLAIFSRNRTHILYGTSAADWNLVQYRKEVGAYARTVQEFGMTLMLDDRGISNLLTAQEYGNFQHNTLSNDILPWVTERKSQVVASMVAREKSQYRLFFNDRYALYTTTKNRTVLGMMPMRFNHTVVCTTSQERSDGNEVMYFGSDNGLVYQLERGTSFDGDPIEAFIETHYIHSSLPRVKKRYRNAALEITGEGFHLLNFTYKIGYNSSGSAKAPNQQVVGEFTDINWDEGYQWDGAISYDGQSLSPSRIKLHGRAENIAITLHSYKDYYSPIAISSVQLRYSKAKEKR